MRTPTILLAALAMAGWTSVCQAQQAGTYSGTTADGNALSFTVGVDSNNGAYEFTGAGLGITAFCKRSNYNFDTGWGFGLGQDIVSGNNNVIVNANQYNYFYINYNLSFTDNNTIQGTVNSDVVAFEPGNPPKKADFCKAPKNMSFTATFQGDSMRAPLPVGTAINYGKIATSSH